MAKANLQRVDEVVAAMAVRDEHMGELADAFVERDGQRLVSARRLGEFLGYRDTSRFMGCVHRAQAIAQQTGRSILDNFVDGNLFDSPGDCWLTPWAASAAIIEADLTKPRVAIAKSYFAALASEDVAADEARLKERQLFKRNHRELHGAAEKAGVNSDRDHAMFDDAGYRGMYNAGIRQVERQKGVPTGHNLIDCAGATELAANNLRMAMTKDSLDRQEASSPSQANQLHKRKGAIVRKAVIDGTGMPPEMLPLEDKTLNELSLQKKRELGSMGS